MSDRDRRGSGLGPGEGGRSDPLLAAAPALFVLLWSTGFVGAKLGLPYAEPLTFLALRFAIVAVLFAAICLLWRAPWPDSPRAVWHIAVAGVLVHAGYLSGVFGAMNLGMNAGLVSLIAGLQPLLVALVAAPLLGERMRPAQWLGTALGVTGVVLVLGPVAFGAGPAGVGAASLALSVLALAGITAGTLYQQRYAARMDLRSGSLIQFTAATLVVLPFAWATESMQVRWSAEFVFALAWLVAVLSFGAITLLQLLIRRGAALRVSSLFYLTPACTALLAWLLFDERLGAAAIAGLAVAALGVALVNRPAA